MKTLHKLKATLLMIIAVVAFSCKKNETAPPDHYNNADSARTRVDSVNTSIDTTTSNSRRGTTGATGEGSTGSGTAGTTQKGTTSIKADSTRIVPKR